MCFPQTTVSVALGSEMRRSLLRELPDAQGQPSFLQVCSISSSSCTNRDLRWRSRKSCLLSRLRTTLATRSCELRAGTYYEVIPDQEYPQYFVREEKSLLPLI